MDSLESAIDELAACELQALPDAALAERVVDLHRAANRLAGAYLTALEVLDRRGAMTGAHGSTAAWLRTATHATPAHASRDVHLARDLADTLPAVAEALAAGEISPVHAGVLAGLRRDLSDAQVRAADAHLAAAAKEKDPVELRGFVTAVRHSYAPEKVVRGKSEAFEARALYAATTIHGTGVGSWTADPASQEVIATAIHAASAPEPGDERSAAQRRFDALVQICRIALDAGVLPATGGVRPHVSVVVELATLQVRAGSPAARLGFAGTISGEAARRIACDAEISRILTGPASEVLDAGRATRSFSAAQRRAIVARDAHCRWPGCDAPSAWCEAHHGVHWADGGSTSVDHAILLCPRHHDRLHRGHHLIVIRPDGSRTVDRMPNLGRADPILDQRADHQRPNDQHTGPARAVP